MSKTQKIAFALFMLIIWMAAFAGSYYASVWIGVPGNWPWLVAVISIPVAGRFTVNAVRQEVCKNFPA